jgi:hypothetical protein
MEVTLMGITADVDVCAEAECCTDECVGQWLADSIAPKQRRRSLISS